MLQYNMSLRRPARPVFQPRPLTLLESALTQTLPRKPFRIRTSVASPDLLIPKDLQRPATPLVSALTGTPCKCGKQTTYNPCRICTYRKLARNPFRIRTYKKPGGGALALPELSNFQPSNFQTFQPANLPTVPILGRHHALLRPFL